VRAPKPNIVASIRTEIATTRVQSWDRACVANDSPVGIECQYPITAAVEKQQLFFLIHGKSPGIDNSAVIVKGTDQRAIALERQKRAISKGARSAAPGRCGSASDHAHRICQRAIVSLEYAIKQ
jgi:hypothetical protein